MKTTAKILKEIKPDAEEKKEKALVIRELSKNLKKYLPKEVKIEPVGSSARGTDLKGARDIDLFMLFPLKYSKDEIVEIGLEAAKKAIEPDDWEMSYAEHPYLKTELFGKKVDVVPAFRIKKIDYDLL